MGDSRTVCTEICHSKNRLGFLYQNRVKGIVGRGELGVTAKGDCVGRAASAEHQRQLLSKVRMGQDNIESTPRGRKRTKQRISEKTYDHWRYRRPWLTTTARKHPADTLFPGQGMPTNRRLGTGNYQIWHRGILSWQQPGGCNLELMNGKCLGVGCGKMRDRGEKKKGQKGSAIKQ